VRIRKLDSRGRVVEDRHVARARVTEPLFAPQQVERSRRARAVVCPEAAAGRVAAVVTCHNYGRYLQQCLESIIGQTRSFDEVVVVCDRCSDDSARIARQWAQGRAGWTVLVTDLGMGPKARNAGVAMTTADFLSFVDADNWLEPGFVERLMPAFCNARVGLAYPRLLMVDELGRPNGNASHAREFDYDALRVKNYIDTCAISRRECWSRVGGWKHHQFLDDWIYALELTRAGWDCQFVDDVLANYRQHAAQTTATHDYQTSRWEAMRDGMELAVVTPFAGRRWALRRYWEALARLDWPAERLRVVAVDNSGDKRFGKELRARLADCKARYRSYVELPTEHANGVSAAKLAGDAELRMQIADATSQALVPLWQTAAGELGTADLVLTWEDDIEPPEGAVRELLWGLDDDVAGVSGLVRLRYEGGNPLLLQDITSTNPTRRAQVAELVGTDRFFGCDFTGFGFTLSRRQAWREIVFRVHPDFASSREHPWYDVAWSRDVRALGWRWRAASNVPVKHWLEGGRQYV
jgi:glycosyltransferase involved in cell wall biosynthesis